MELSDRALASAEFVAVDVETNGRSGGACELTEIGAVLVGGGELHESFESLVRTEQPLGRGIERLTGITQAMVDAAPPPAEALGQLGAIVAGRVLVAHSAAFDARALHQGFERAGLRWPSPPVLCTIRLARRFAPLATRHELAALADALGIEVHARHRALPDALTCGRIFCALFPRLCASAGTVGDALALMRRKRHRQRPPARRRADRPDLSQLPDDPGVYVFRDVAGQPLYVGKSVSVKTRARAHFCAPADWPRRAETVDYRATNSELGALVLENRLIKAWRPPGNVKLRRVDRYVYLCCRLDIPYPVLEVRREPAPGHAVNVGPLWGRDAAEDLAGELSSLFMLRRCGRRLPRRDHPSAYGQMGRCLSPCLGDLDPNLYRRRLDEALAVFDGEADAAERLLGRMEVAMREAAAERRFERAQAIRRRRERLLGVVDRLRGVLRAVHARPRLVLAAHPTKARFDALWVVGGRVVDWGALPPLPELTGRTRAATARAASCRHAAALDRRDVDEVRIVSSWLATHDVPQLPLDPSVDAGRLRAWLESSAAA